MSTSNGGFYGSFEGEREIPAFRSNHRPLLGHLDVAEKDRSTGGGFYGSIERERKILAFQLNY